MTSLRKYQIYNNLVFFIPITLGIYKHELIFTVLASLILLGSAAYHLSLEQNNRYVRQTRLLDILIAFLCYAYLFYFVAYRKENAVQALLYLSLISTLMVYMAGKRFKSDFVHALFHASIAVAAGIIVML